MTRAASPDQNPTQRTLRTRVGCEVGCIGFGTMGLGGYLSRDESSDMISLAALEVAFETGVKLFDTAEAYGGGHTEELMGEVLPAVRDEVFISTKVSPENLRPEAVRTAAYGSLERLRTDFIDLYYIHWPNPAIALEETLAAMSALVDEGVVRHIGLSNFAAAEASEAELLVAGYGIAAVQAEYNLFDRTNEADLLPFARARGIPFVAYSPLDVGRLISPRGNASIDRLARRAGLTPAQLILKWVTRDAGVLAIPKAASADHIRDNAAVATADVPSEVLLELGRLFTPTVRHVDPRRIRTDDNGIDSFVPGPKILAAALQGGATFKPVRLVVNDTDSAYDYDLVEGKLRYSAWVNAFSDGRPVPALIRE